MRLRLSELGLLKGMKRVVSEMGGKEKRNRIRGQGAIDPDSQRGLAYEALRTKHPSDYGSRDPFWRLLNRLWLLEYTVLQNPAAEVVPSLTSLTICTDVLLESLRSSKIVLSYSKTSSKYWRTSSCRRSGS